MSPRPRFYPPLLCSLFCCLVGGPLARFFQQQSMSRPWSLFSSSAGSLRGCVWFPWSAGGGVACTVKDPCILPERLVVSRPGVLCDCRFLCLSSSCGCLVLLQTHLRCPLCFPNVLLPITTGDLVNHSIVRSMWASSSYKTIWHAFSWWIWLLLNNCCLQRTLQLSAEYTWRLLWLHSSKWRISETNLPEASDVLPNKGTHTSFNVILCSFQWVSKTYQISFKHVSGPVTYVSIYRCLPKWLQYMAMACRFNAVLIQS